MKVSRTRGRIRNLKEDRGMKACGGKWSLTLFFVMFSYVMWLKLGDDIYFLCIRMYAFEHVHFSVPCFYISPLFVVTYFYDIYCC